MFSNLNAATGAVSDGSNVLSQKEVALVNYGILDEAIKGKDYDTISTMAITLYSTAQSPQFSGNREALRKKGLGLLALCHVNGHIVSSLYLIKALMKSFPAQAEKVARDAISIRNSTKNTKLSHQDIYNSIVLLYVSFVLDNKESSKEDYNNAIESLERLNIETPQIDFFSAFLFRKLGSDEMADVYLTAACSKAKPGSKIFS